MASQGGKAVPRFAAPTAASAARARVPSDSGPAQGAPRPAITAKRIQTPHPKLRARVPSDSSDGSTGSSGQSSSRYRAPTAASSARSRIPSDSSVRSGDEKIRNSPRSPTSSSSSAAAATKPPLANHLEAMAAQFRASTEARKPQVADQPTGLSGHLAGMAAAFQANAARAPSFARPTAASAARAAPEPLRPILKESSKLSTRHKLVGYAGRLTGNLGWKARKAAKLVGQTVSDTTRCLIPGRKPRGDISINTDRPTRVRFDSEEEWWEIPRDKQKGRDVWLNEEISGRRPLHDFVQDIYLRW